MARSSDLQHDSWIIPAIRTARCSPCLATMETSVCMTLRSSHYEIFRQWRNWPSITTQAGTIPGRRRTETKSIQTPSSVCAENQIVVASCGLHSEKEPKETRANQPIRFTLVPIWAPDQIIHLPGLDYPQVSAFIRNSTISQVSTLVKKAIIIPQQ